MARFSVACPARFATSGRLAGIERRPNTQTVQWFLENHASGQLVLDPPFQRRTVWSAEYRRFFIDTVLRNFPSPSIFIEWAIKPGEPTIYNVIDGKQRLSALIEFAAGDFHLADLFENEGYDRPYWKDLAAEMHQRFVNYVLTVENLTHASDTELRDAFDRLNRNVARLTPQELRHAQFPGVFLQRMEALAEASFWTEKRIVTPANIRRMRDVELVSELFILTMYGVQDGAAAVIDRYYAEYDEEIPDEAINRRRFDEIMDWLDHAPLDWGATRWGNLNDIYALWGALHQWLITNAALPDPDDAAGKLTAFSDTQADILLAERARQVLPGSDEDRRYFANVRAGGNKDTNRQALVGILFDLLSS
jgi:hypothetical protein